MQRQRTVISEVRAAWSAHKARIVSATVHAVVVGVLLSGIHFAAKTAPYRLPGTARGVSFLTYYSPGSRTPKTSTPAVTVAQQKAPPTPVPRPVPAPLPVQAEVASSEAGSGSSAKSGMGEGNISIALPTHFPYPKADLSAMAHGASGDVILNATIDEHGKISELTLVQGLGAPIDQFVIATVQQWSYSPATRNGVPVASEQEIHFHYERS